MLRIVNLEFQQVSFFNLFLFFFSMIIGQCFDELTVEFHLSVFANLVQEEPIGKVTRIEETSDDIRASRSHIQQSQLQPDDRYTDDDQFVKHLDGSNGRQENKPEPESKVDFFVDDILGQNAEMTFYFKFATRSEPFREIAWDGSRENFAHRIQSTFCVVVQVLQDIRSIRWEIGIKEITGNVEVGNQDDYVQDLAKKEFEVIDLISSFQHSE